MAVVVPSLQQHQPFSSSTSFCKVSPGNPSGFLISKGGSANFPSTKRRRLISICNGLGEESNQKNLGDEEVESLGVKVALSMLRFYKREISPALPKSCRYVPTCSEYSIEAYKRYGVTKGTILMVWRVCRCNPLGGSGYDPPRWFDEKTPPEE